MSIRQLYVLAALVMTNIAYAQEMRVVTSAPDGQVRFVAPPARAASQLGVRADTDPRAASRVALREYAKYFGVEQPDTVLREHRGYTLGNGKRVFRYRQLRDGLPIIGAEMVVSLTPENQFATLTGKTSAGVVDTTVPTISSSQARRTAAIAVAKYNRVPIVSLVTSEPELSIYDPKMIGPKSSVPPSLVWRVEVTHIDPREAIRQFILIDARSGAMALNFNQVETALNRTTYTANGTNGLQTTLVCNESQPGCTNGANADADAAHKYAGETYAFYSSRFGRDSYDNAGATIISTVNSTYMACTNAGWLGSQMVYCPGSVVDDVVGHELTHAVTQSTSGLLYYYESGAINESMSDVFGEFIDLTNTSGTDTPAVRWMVAEDWPGGFGIRNMMDPTLRSGADSMTSPLYYAGSDDNGGVHSNSGVNNKAAALLTDGGQFNGFTITGLGLEKVARLYYTVQTQYLTSGSGYADLYTALRQACQNLIGQNGFVAADCLQVNKVTDATEMNLEPKSGFNPEAPICAPGRAPSYFYLENFENAPDTSRWVTGATVGANGWGVANSFATSGKKSYAIVNALTSASDSTLTQVSRFTLQPNAYLHFRHSFDFEYNGSGDTFAYDGGVVEYTIDDGATWRDLSPLYDAGANYGGVLVGSNPLAGRQAFVSASHGFVSSRYNLSSLAGNIVRFRFRNAADNSVASTPNRAWVIDDVRIYTCVGSGGGPNTPPVANAGPDMTGAPSTIFLLRAANSSDSDGTIASVQWSQVSGPAVTIGVPNSWSTYFIAPGVLARDTIVMRLQVTDNQGATATDDVSFTVINQQPVANAGVDRTVRPGVTVSLTGSGTDADGSISAYAWRQVSGPTVAINNTNSAQMSFVAPPTATSVPLVFRLTVFDNYLGNGQDDITVNVVNAQPTVIVGADIDSKPRTTISIGSTSGDSDGSVVSLVWTQVSGPPVTIANPNATTAVFVVPSVANTATVVLRATATDNDGGTGSDDIAIQISNVQPTANAGADRNVDAGASVSITGSGADTDGSITAYQWTQISGAAVTMSGAATNSMSFAAPSLSTPSTLVFRLAVTDNDNAVATDDVTINVAAVPAPPSGGGGGGGMRESLLALLLLCAMLRNRGLHRLMRVDS